MSNRQVLIRIGRVACEASLTAKRLIATSKANACACCTSILAFCFRLQTLLANIRRCHSEHCVMRVGVCCRSLKLRLQPQRKLL